MKLCAFFKHVFALASWNDSPESVISYVTKIYSSVMWWGEKGSIWWCYFWRQSSLMKGLILEHLYVGLSSVAYSHTFGVRHAFSLWLHLKLHTSLLYSRRKQYVTKKYDRIHSTHERVGKKYPDDLLLLAWFWSVHRMDTLLSHEAAGEDLWMAAKQRNWRW